MKLRIPVAILIVLAGVALPFLSSAFGGQILRNGFETPDTAWIQSGADVHFKELIHDNTDEVFNNGQRSEHIQLQVETGSSKQPFIHYAYDVGKAPLADELTASVWVRANRGGIQLMARLVLPHERGKTADEPLTTFIRGDFYQSVSRFQKLQIRQPVNLAKEERLHLSDEQKHQVNMADAYFDKLILNVYCGPGPTELWIDDLEIGPVTDPSRSQTEFGNEGFKPTAREPAGGGQPRRSLESKDHRPIGSAQLVDERLLVGGRPVFFRIMRHSGTPLSVLREARINGILFDEGTPPEKLAEAARMGFYVVPTVSSKDAGGANPQSLAQTVSDLQKQAPALFVNIDGGGLTADHVQQVTAAAKIVQDIDPQIQVAADVWEAFQAYSRSIRMLGVHRWPLLTSLELSQYRDWLTQRRVLAGPPRGENTFMWTWIQTHLPDWYTHLVYDRPGSASFSEPIGPQPEHIRLLTYIALGSGCKGLGFWSDRFLADSHQGRDRLLALALLNMELHMLEPMLVSSQTPIWIDTSVPDVKAAVFYPKANGQGILVLPVWLGSGSQFVPGQAAIANLSIVVPRVPTSSQAWDVSPAEVRGLKSERVPGGTKITVPEFGLTSAIVLTGDNGREGLLVRMQGQAMRTSRLAAQWCHDLAEEELRKVAAINAELEQAGHKLPDGKELLENAQKRLGAAVQLWNSGDYREAYAESERTLRPVRILMRAQWEAATKELDVPVASPYAVSFYTLPRHWQFMNQIQTQIKQGNIGANVLQYGDFETPPDRLPDSWTAQVPEPLDKVDLSARRVTTSPHSGKQCLELQVKPKSPIAAAGSTPPPPPPAALERTFLAITSPTVRLDPGTPVRIQRLGPHPAADHRFRRWRLAFRQRRRRTFGCAHDRRDRLEKGDSLPPGACQRPNQRDPGSHRPWHRLF